MARKSINDLIIEYFMQHQNVDMPHGPVVDWVEEQYVDLYGRKPRDTWRAVRKLYETGYLIQVKKGVYRYDPDRVSTIAVLDFPPETKIRIFERDEYKCVVCGRGRETGVELCADHIKPKSRGGDDSLDNGQTLCTEHNLMKKNYSQTEAAKRYFIRVHKLAIANSDQCMVDFCNSIFDVYDQYGIDDHIQRPR
jgi:hypothetical protein